MSGTDVPRRLKILQGLAALLRDVAVALAALVGGIWAVTQFTLTQQMMRANLEIQEKTLEIEAAAQSLREGAGLDVEVSAWQADTTTTDQCLVVGVATLRNRRAAEMMLDYGVAGRPIVVGRLAVSDHEASFENVAGHSFVLPEGRVASPQGGDGDLEVGAMRLPPGRSLALPFLAPVPEPGVYAVVLLPPEAGIQIGQDRPPSPDHLVLLGATTVEIKAGNGCRPRVGR